jgi:hypothetical protein
MFLSGQASIRGMGEAIRAYTLITQIAPPPFLAVCIRERLHLVSGWFDKPP